MKKAAGAVFLLVGAVLVAGGIDKKSGLNNFVADVQADESEGQNTAADTEKEESVHQCVYKEQPGTCVADECPLCGISHGSGSCDSLDVCQLPSAEGAGYPPAEAGLGA